MIAGILTGVTVALVGWFAGWFFFLRPEAGLTESMVILHVSTGAAGGLGAAVAWVRLDDGIPVNVLIVLLTLAGGIGGAMAALVNAGVVLDIATAKSEGNIAAIAAAGIAANIPPLLYYMAQHIRARRQS